MSSERRWTATIEFRNDAGRTTEVIQATVSEYNLQRDQLRAAVREAAEYITAGLAADAYVQLYKTTQAHGTVLDQGWQVYVDDRTGKVRAQY